jgi:hypothetical protein
LFSEDPAATGHQLCAESIDYLEKVIESRVCGNKTQVAFAKKFLDFLKLPQKKKIFLQQYTTAERNHCLKQSTVKVEGEVETTGNELVGKSLRQISQKRQV